MSKHPVGSLEYFTLKKEWFRAVDQEWRNIEKITTPTEQHMILSTGEQAAARIIERITKDMKNEVVR